MLINYNKKHIYQIIDKKETIKRVSNIY